MVAGIGVEIAHALPRRVRLSAPPLRGQTATCTRTARVMSERGGFSRVTVRPETGSVIIEQDTDALDPATVAALLDAVLRQEHDDVGQSLSRSAPNKGTWMQPTRVARAVVRAAAGIDAELRRALAGYADLGTLLPAWFAVTGLIKLGAGGELPVPVWYNLLWWSMRSFMTFNLGALDELSEGDETAGRARI